MEDIEMFLSLLNRDHHQIYFTPIARALKSIEAAIIFQEFIQRYQYHKIREELIEIPGHGGTWFYHTKEHIEERTAMSRYGQDKAIAILKEFHLIETVQYGMPCKRYIKLNLEGIEEFSKNLSRKSTVDRQESSPSADKAADRQPTDSLYIEEPNKEPNKDMSELPFGRIASSFFEKLKKKNPKIKSPNLKKWAKEFELLSKDGNSLEDIQKVIDYLFATRDRPSTNGFCWANVILCPSTLRKHFARLWGEINSPVKEFRDSYSKENEELALKIWNKLKGRKEQDIELGYKYLEFKNGPTVEYLEFTDKDFRKKCLEQLRKRNITVENL